MYGCDCEIEEFIQTCFFHNKDKTMKLNLSFDRTINSCVLLFIMEIRYVLTYIKRI